MVDGVAASALDWWVEAGVDVIVDDLPRNWLAPPAARSIAASPVESPVTAPPPPVPSALPADLPAFRQWLLNDAGVPGHRGARIDSFGDHASGTVVVVDMPEAEDRAAAALLSGPAGALFDRMLGAMKLGRDAIYMLPFSPARAASGRIAEGDGATLATLLAHHLALVAPKRLLLLGDAPTRALLGKPLAQARDAVHQAQVSGMAVPTVATFHPRFVLARPEYRQPVWADLQKFMAL